MSNSCSCNDLPGDMKQVAPAYRRALWIVALMNIGYSVLESGAGFFARSQALKADALDFLGDGLITFLGAAAIGWRAAWRAKAAMLQGLFLTAMAVGVLLGTVYRLFVLGQPNPELMGIFGALALVTNLAAAAVLIPHRAGDANVRAVWLFSRNDAIGNAAVVIAAGLVVWTGTRWPDLVVAVVIAGLFLQSSWSIIKDARADLRQTQRSAKFDVVWATPGRPRAKRSRARARRRPRLHCCRRAPRSTNWSCRAPRIMRRSRLSGSAYFGSCKTRAGELFRVC